MSEFNFYEKIEDKYRCPQCSKLYSNKGIGIHIWRAHTEKGRSIDPNIGYKNGRIIWNKGLTSETDLRVKKCSETFSENVKNGKIIIDRSRTIYSEERRFNLSESAKAHNLGGVRQSKWIKYKDKILGSTYELQVVIDLEKNNIKWDTCSKFKYEDPFGKIRSYTPDLYLSDYDIYLDPKNDFLINNINPSLGFKDIDKIKLVEIQNNIKVFVLSKLQLNWEYIKSLIEK